MTWASKLSLDPALAEPDTSLVFDVEDAEGFRVRLENMPGTPLSLFRVTAWHGDRELMHRVGDDHAERACECALGAIRDAGATGARWVAVAQKAKVIDWARAAVLGGRELVN